MAVLSRDPTSVPEATASPERRGLAPELLVAAGLLTILGAIMLGGHVLHGGLYTDDWPITWISVEGGTSTLIHQLILGDHSRPLAAIYLALAAAVTGTNAHAHDAVGLAVHIVTCWSIFWLSRTLTLTRWQAGAISLLVLLFPFADSSWLWFAVTQSSVSLCVMVLGLIAMIYAVRADGVPLLALHAVGTLLIVASVLLYETSTAVAVVAVAAIQLTHARWRVALVRTLAVLGAVVVALVVPRVPGVLPGSEPHHGLPLSQQFHHARLIASQAFTVLTDSAVPFGAAHRNVVVPILGLILVLALGAWMRAPRGSAARSEFGRWLAVVGGGAVVVAAAYAVFVDTDFSYQPIFSGAQNRINVVAAVGYCLIIYGVAMLTALLITGRDRPRPRAAVVTASAAALVVAFGYAQRTRTDIRNWDHAATIQDRELARLSTSLGRPAPGTTIFAFGGVGQVAPNVSAFSVTWDLDTAVELRWKDPTINAYPIFSGTTFVCTASTVTPSGFWNSAGTPPPTVGYGHALFFDFRSGRRQLVRNQRDCLRAERRFRPGPLLI